MFEELMNLVKQSSGDAIINNPAIPNGQNNAVMAEAGNAIASTLQDALANGNANQVLSMFGNNGANINNNPLTQQMSGNFVDNISSRLGISPTVAKGIAAVVIPIVLSKMIHRTNDPNDNGFNIQDIFSKLTGGATNGLNLPDILKNFTGGGSQPQIQPQAAPTASAVPQSSGDDYGIGGLFRSLGGSQGGSLLGTLTNLLERRS